MSAPQLHDAAPAHASSSTLPTTTRMRAVVQTEYGTPEVLRVTEVERPSLPDDRVLVRVHVVGVHIGDWHLLTGTPYLVRLAGFGVLRPKNTTPGMAVAGRVVAVGARVTSLSVGDAVFGELPSGGFAEFVVADPKLLVRKPHAVSDEDAACLPVSATTALQGLRDAGRLQAGQSVLIHGASGGVGLFAVQIAKALGAEVTAVCSGRNVAQVRALGADHVIDYTQEDFTKGARRHDVIFDLVGDHPISDCRAVLTPKGRFVACAGGAQNRWLGPLPGLLAGLAGNPFRSQVFVPLAAMPKAADLSEVAELVATGKLRVVIDRRFTLDEVPEALRYQGLGHSRGKNVVTVCA